MKSLVRCLVVSAIILSASIGYSQTPDEYIKKAEDYQKSGNLEQAAKVMEEATEKYPENSTACSYLGLYLGMQAGKTQNYMEAGRLIDCPIRCWIRLFHLTHKTQSLYSIEDLWG